MFLGSYERGKQALLLKRACPRCPSLLGMLALAIHVLTMASNPPMCLDGFLHLGRASLGCPASFSRPVAHRRI